VESLTPAQRGPSDLVATQKWNAKIAAYSDALAIFLLKARRPEKYGDRHEHREVTWLPPHSPPDPDSQKRAENR
jgi:hypothetical protein